MLIIAAPVCASENDQISDDQENSTLKENQSVDKIYEEKALIKKAQVMKEDRESPIVIQSVSPPEGFTLAGLLNCSNRVRNYIENNGVCPNYVDYYYTSGSIVVTARLPMPDYLFLISKVIVNKYEGNNSNIKASDFYSANINPSSPTGDSINGQISSANFYTYAKNVVNWYKNNGNAAPNYVNTNLGRMQYQTAIYMFSRIGQYIYLNNAIPTYVTVSVPISHTMNKYMPDYHPSEL
ncbi:hypothetical protein [Methanobrevibacter arboriphilus]|uniref:hypothetical protein n=1 Tax=Methanobrevibacter arboriphilus TaxID=39441 RepID=UPI0005B2D30B|nr:hypothetical protein [Methanobrevibacter arboriphilus]